ncbi:MAG TPA: Rieske 2Fe-2S domain-containing protein [Candidatus Dormibacteraeota bacterium]|nr:Rieske 2Fe-2S domain-containing protein [Candidatus Dormibacteraeota bacterium]
MADQTEPKPAESTTAPGPVAPTAAVPKPPATTKKVTESPAPSGPDKTRRTIIWSLVWGYFGVNFLMFLRFFFPRTLFEPKTIFSIGYPQDFGLGVETKFQREFRIWVDKVPGRIFVIYARCTHLGCTPDWKPAENKFKCPCHGSGYDSEAINFEGPAPRPMDRCHVELDATGQIVVDTNRLYVRDPKAGRDEFDSPGAYLPA